MNDIYYQHFIFSGIEKPRRYLYIVTVKFARWRFLLAGIWGILVLAPLYFLESLIGVRTRPSISHPEYFYGFVGLGLTWQIVFPIIAN